MDTNGHDGGHVFSPVQGGTVSGFDRGVAVSALSDGATVKQLTLTGPALAPVPPYGRRSSAFSSKRTTPPRAG